MSTHAQSGRGSVEIASPNAFCTGLGAFSASRRTRSRTPPAIGMSARGSRLPDPDVDHRVPKRWNVAGCRRPGSRHVRTFDSGSAIAAQLVSSIEDGKEQPKQRLYTEHQRSQRVQKLTMRDCHDRANETGGRNQYPEPQRSANEPRGHANAGTRPAGTGRSTGFCTSWPESRSATPARAGLLRAQEGRRQSPDGSDALREAPSLRHRLPTDAQPLNATAGDEPGRANGKRLCLQRDRLTSQRRLFGQATSRTRRDPA